MRDIESYYNPFRADNTKEPRKPNCVITLDRRKSDTFVKTRRRQGKKSA